MKHKAGYDSFSLRITLHYVVEGATVRITLRFMGRNMIVMRFRSRDFIKGTNFIAEIREKILTK